MDIQFTVPDMTCGHCVKAITSAIAAADPAARVDIDLASHRVSVHGAKDQQVVAGAIAEAGYTVTPA